jgi:hypothetical protein
VPVPRARPTAKEQNKEEEEEENEQSRRLGRNKKQIRRIKEARSLIFSPHSILKPISSYHVDGEKMKFSPFLEFDDDK